MTTGKTTASSGYFGTGTPAEVASGLGQATLVSSWLRAASQLSPPSTPPQRWATLVAHLLVPRPTTSPIDSSPRSSQTMAGVQESPAASEGR